jgi:hypothetical protein
VLRNVTAHYATNNEAVKLLPTPGSGEATPRSGREAPFDVAIHDAKEGVKGGKKRHKQCPQWGSSVGRVTIAARSGKRQALPPTDHFERLLEVACPNHAYPVKHKLKDCDMIKNFMVSGFLTQGMELDKVSSRRNTTPFTEEDAVMTIYDGRPPHQGGTACLT